MPAPSPARLYQQICDRSDIRPKYRRAILIRCQGSLIDLTSRGETDQVRLFRLFDCDQHPVPWRRRRLDRGQPPVGNPGLVDPIDHMSGENATVGLLPCGELDARDLGGVVGARGSDKAKRHARKAYGVTVGP